jgi:LysM repeat protein
MNNPIRKFRKFLVKPKKMNATAVRSAAASTYDEESDDTKLSGAFIIVLILHIVAVVGIVAFTKIKDGRKATDSVAAASTLAKPKGGGASPVSVAGLGGSKAPNLAPETTPAETPVVENNPPRTLPSTGTQVHNVKQGESLAKIAFAYGTTTTELARINGIKNPAELHPGQILNIPDRNSLPPLPAATERHTDPVKNSPPKTTPPTAAPAKSGTYVIKRGDNLMQIARINNVKYEDLTAANKGIDPKKIQPGQVLKLPSKK